MKPAWKKDVKLCPRIWELSYEHDNIYGHSRRSWCLEGQITVMQVERVLETPFFYFFEGHAKVYDAEGGLLRDSFEITKRRKPFLLPDWVQEQLERSECMK